MLKNREKFNMKTPKSAYFREMHPYSLEEVKSVLGIDIDSAKKVVSALKRSGVAKAVNRKIFDLDRLTEEREVIAEDISENSDIAYVMNYVGVVYTEDCVLKCYPKYIDQSKEPKDELKLALKAIQKHNDKVQSIHLYNGEDRSSFNMLGLVLHILHDYYENGIYTNYQEVIETNGEGEIDWDRTINETFAYLKDNRPYYLELKTIANQTDDFDYFKRLHECIVTECSKYLENLGLTELFDDVPFVQLTEATLDDFGDVDYIKYRLEREIASQFVTRKQMLLKTLYTYVAEKKTDEQEDSFSLWGTNSLNLVWEHACGEIFGNIYKEVKVTIDSQSPKWFIDGKELKTKDSDLIPDILTKCTLDENTDEKVFCILDGKYYLLQIKGDSLSRMPGVQDIVKQFVYHKALVDYIRKTDCLSVFNALLFPWKESEVSKNEDNTDVRIRGSISMMNWGFQFDNTNSENLVPIYVAFLKPSFVWENYVNGKICRKQLVQAMKKIRFPEDVIGDVLNKERC